MKDKNIVVDFILCLFLGYLGIHKFYEGKSSLGIVYLLTMGLFGIGWIIDIISLFLKMVSPNTCFTQNNISNISNIKESYIKEETPKRTRSLYSRTKTSKLVDDYVVFDLETTGFNPEENAIIEIAALKYNNNTLVDSFSSLVNPNIPIPKKITKLTGITDNDVSNCETIDKVLPGFINFIENYTLIAHNGSFDFSFIENNINKLNITYSNNPNIDTLYLARKYLPDLDNHKLETLKKHFKLDNISHRATSDCETTNFVYQYCKSNKLSKIK